MKKENYVLTEKGIRQTKNGKVIEKVCKVEFQTNRKIKLSSSLKEYFLILKKIYEKYGVDGIRIQIGNTCNKSMYSYFDRYLYNTGNPIYYKYSYGMNQMVQYIKDTQVFN